MKHLILAIIISIVLYLANRQNANLVASWEGLDENQVLEAKKKWAYEFWKVRTKQFTITLFLLFGGLTTLVLAAKDILVMLALALMLGCFVYFLVIGFKNARYNLFMKDFDNEGLSKSEIINQFKDWRIKGL
jgi:hypothetical protein